MFHKLMVAYFGFFGVFWFLGVDQLCFALFCFVGLLSHLLGRKKIPTLEVWLFAGFLIATVMSASQVETTHRYITYLRNEGVYLAMFFILLSSTFKASNYERSTNQLYLALLFFSLQASIVAFLASSGIGIAFKSIGAYVIPDMGSKYVAGMLNKSTIMSEASWFSEGFDRPRGLMLYANTMAGVLCASMALKAYFLVKFWVERRRLVALVCLAAVFMDVFSVYSALSRSTWIGFAFALAVFPFAFKTSLPAKFIPGIIALLAAGLLVATGLNEGIEKRLTEKTHSNEGRGHNYVLIWQMTTSSVENFLVGHGTQLDHPDLTIPVGSHSTYMGMFFKFGIVGLSFFMLFMAALYLKMLKLTRDVQTLNRFGHKISRPYFVCFALVVLLVQMTVIEVDVDASYALFVAALIYLIVKESERATELLRHTRGSNSAPTSLSVRNMAPAYFQR